MGKQKLYKHEIEKKIIAMVRGNNRVLIQGFIVIFVYLFPELFRCNLKQNFRKSLQIYHIKTSETFYFSDLTGFYSELLFGVKEIESAI